jgi:hypothetical protein
LSRPGWAKAGVAASPVNVIAPSDRAAMACLKVNVMGGVLPWEIVDAVRTIDHRECCMNGTKRGVHAGEGWLDGLIGLTTSLTYFPYIATTEDANWINK